MTIFKKVWNIWKKFGHFIGTVISLIIYIIFITPFGIVIRLSKDYLGEKSYRKSMWLKKKSINLDIKEMRKQY